MPAQLIFEENILNPGRYILDLKPSNLRFTEETTYKGKTYEQGTIDHFTAAEIYEMLYDPKTSPNFAGKVVKTTGVLSPFEQAALAERLGQDQETRKSNKENLNKGKEEAYKILDFNNNVRVLREKIADANAIGAVGQFAVTLENFKEGTKNLYNLLVQEKIYDQTKSKEEQMKDQAIRQRALDIAMGSTKEDSDGVNIEKYFNKTKERKQIWKFITETAKGSAGKDSVFTELLYRIAKLREEGGRFSVSDIELAAKALGGGGSSKEVAYAALDTIEEIFVTGSFNNLNIRFDIRDEGFSFMDLDRTKITEETLKDMNKMHKNDLKKIIEFPFLRSVIKAQQRLERNRVKKAIENNKSTVPEESEKSRIDKIIKGNQQNK